MAVGALINDPTGLAWFVVASYLAGAAVAFLAGRSTDGRDARFWYAAAILLALLGVNKELDSQSLMTESARAVSREPVHSARRPGCPVPHDSVQDR